MFILLYSEILIGSFGQGCSDSNFKSSAVNAKNGTGNKMALSFFCSPVSGVYFVAVELYHCLHMKTGSFTVILVNLCHYFPPSYIKSEEDEPGLRRSYFSA